MSITPENGQQGESVPRTVAKRRRASREQTRPSMFWLLAGVLVPLSRLMAKITIVDREKLPREGAYILAPNHYSEIDPVIVGVAVWRSGRAPRFMAKASLFKNGFVGWVLRGAGQIPVEREGSTRGPGPIEAAGQAVRDGKIVVVYPEGTLTRDPELWPMRGKTGAARMALTHGLPVIPVAHWGTQNVMARYSKKISFFPPKPVTVTFGDPVDLSAFADRPIDSATLAEATDVVMDAIADLLAGLRPGEIPPKERWDPSKHNQKETGRF